MTKEIAPMTAVQDKIKDRIRSEFVDLIPDEMWASMVQAVVNDFTTDKANRYSGPAEPAPIKKMIRDEIEAICKEQIAKELRKHQASFDGVGARVVAEATKELIEKNAPAMLAAMQAGMTQMMVDSAINALRNGIGQY